MPRYGRPERAWVDYDEPFRPDITVAEHQPVKTGLIWKTGEPIVRLPNPLGFGRDHEW